MVVVMVADNISGLELASVEEPAYVQQLDSAKAFHAECIESAMTPSCPEA